MQKTKISIGLLWLFTISGIIGILSPAKDWFLMLTPLNLSLSFVILCIHLKGVSKHTVHALAIPFLLGFITEALGVNYGLLFGTYSYGANLGFKVLGVPLIICVNWCMLTMVTADLAKYLSKNKWIRIGAGAFIMTLLDVVIEVSAPRFDFWAFEGGIVPLQNYLAWFAIASLAHLGYQSYEVDSKAKISFHVFASIFVFFAVFLVF